MNESRITALVRNTDDQSAVM